MARVPRFAVVGRLGLLMAAVAVAAALWSTTALAMASTHPSPGVPTSGSPSSVVAVTDQP